MAPRSQRVANSSDGASSSSSSDSEDSARSRPQSEHSPDPAPEDSSSSTSDDSRSSSSDEDNSDDSQRSSIQGDELEGRDDNAVPSPDDNNIEDQLREEDRGLDSKFTPSQLEQLLALRERYRFASAKERKEIALKTGESFRDDLIRQGQALTQLQTKNLFTHVRIWFSQRARTRREPVRWTVNWTARQVFYKQNTALVAATQRAMFEANTGMNPGEGTAKVDLDLVDDDDNSSPVGGKGPSLFNFFQKALSAEWDQLLPEEKERYEILATEWRTDGPSEEVRKALAEKEACRVIRFLAQDLYRQMGVRLFVLANYEDSNDDVIAVSLDFNNELGSNGASYKLAAKSYLERVDLLNNYAAFAKKAVPQEGEIVDRRTTAKSMTFELNGRGEAILPDPNQKDKPLKDYVWYPSVVRRFMHFDWARAQGQPMRGNNGPSWVNICNNVSKYIDPEYLPEGAEPLKDPGAYNLKNCKKLVLHWWDRQQRGLTAFQFRGYWDGADFVERMEDEYIPEDEGSDFKPPTRKGKNGSAPRPTDTKKAKSSAKVGQTKAPTKGKERITSLPDHPRGGSSTLKATGDPSKDGGKGIPRPRPTQPATQVAKAPPHSMKLPPLEVLSSGTQDRGNSPSSARLVEATQGLAIDADRPNVPPIQFPHRSTATLVPNPSKKVTDGDDGPPKKPMVNDEGTPQRRSRSRVGVTGEQEKSNEETTNAKTTQSHSAEGARTEKDKKKHGKRKEKHSQAGIPPDDGERDGSKLLKEKRGEHRAGADRKESKETRIDDERDMGEAVASEGIDGQSKALPSERKDRQPKKSRKKKTTAGSGKADTEEPEEETSGRGVAPSMGKEANPNAGHIRLEHVGPSHVTPNLPDSATVPTKSVPKGRKKSKKTTMDFEEAVSYGDAQESPERESGNGNENGKGKGKGKGKRVRVMATEAPVEASAAAFDEAGHIDEEDPRGSPRKQSAEDRDILSNATSGKYWQLTSATRRKRENSRYTGGL